MTTTPKSCITKAGKESDRPIPRFRRPTKPEATHHSGLNLEPLYDDKIWAVALAYSRACVVCDIWLSHWLRVEAVPSTYLFAVFRAQADRDFSPNPNMRRFYTIPRPAEALES